MSETTRTPWWMGATVYQIYPRSFADSNGDGIGDLQGVLRHLDYLKQLGVDALWLSPIFRSPMADAGYDISDYCDIDPLFGSLADIDRLIAEAHARDIRVLLDFVPNHTSDEHPWFVESRSSRATPSATGTSGGTSRTTGALRWVPAAPGPGTSTPSSTTCTCSWPSSRT